jgi:ABC-2 type transport system permease protein
MTATAVPITYPRSFALSNPSSLHGFAVLVARRIRVTTKTASGVIAQLVTPILWVLVVAPALASSRGAFNPNVDYYTFLAAGQVAFLIPFTAMFNGINVIVDRQFGVLPEMLVAPIRRSLIPIANAVAVLLITAVQVALIIVLGRLRGAHFHTSAARLPWFVLAAAFLCLIVYGIAETLALKINRQEAYGPLIPAIGVTPYFLAGALYPLSVLPAGLQQTAYVLPWTHAVALIRYGLMEHNPSGLLDIWGVGNELTAALLSLAVLGLMAAASLALAARVFVRTTTR